MTDIADYAEKLGINSMGLEIDIYKLGQIDLPVILHWDKDHFVVLFDIDDNYYFIADPAYGIMQMNMSDFLMHWQNHEKDDQRMGILLAFAPNN